jgi:leucine dehydrogenase
LKAERAQREFGANIVPLDKIFEVECDVIAPCALGSALNDTSIPRIKAKIVAGAANNQLAQPRHGDDLHARGILYAPDYAINAGGLVNVAQEVLGYDAQKSRGNTMKIYDTIYEIADRSSKTGTPAYRVADTLVEEKLAQVSKATPRSK